MKAAMKAGEALKVSTLRMVISEIKKKEIDKRSPLEPGEIQKTLSSMIKQRHDSVEAFTKGDRLDLADKEKAEIAILAVYQPQQMSAGDVEKLVDEAIKESGASSPADIGKVMKAALAKSAGRADGKLINEIARNKLTPK